ncbi:hypothetical protein ACROYT_G035654 [Oculina patagonica]
MKPFRIVSSSDITSSLSNKSDTPLEWSKCIFCQEGTGKKLVCPADYADRFKGAGYKTIAETSQAFYDLGCLPDDVNLTRMNDGDGLEQTFVSRRTKFHTTCSLKFNKNELQRATKWKASADEEKNFKTSSKKMKPLVFVSFVTNLQQIQNHSIKPQHWTSTLECASVQYRDRAGTLHDQDDTNTAKSTAFAELISYIQDALEDKDTTPVFQLSELKKLYADRVDQLGGDPSVVHSIRLKE